MKQFELTNEQRKYFGLTPVADNWERESLSDILTVYFNGNKIVKILNYNLGYVECDVDINTKERKFILPKTAKGKEQKLTIQRILKAKGSGIQFSGSFQGGGIHVYDYRRRLFFIKSFKEEGEIISYQDINRWISNYISTQQTDYFEWLNKQLSQKRLRVKIREGDIIAFKISQTHYSFARVLLDVFKVIKKKDIINPELHWVHPRSLIVAIYGYYTDTLSLDIDIFTNKKISPSLYIFDTDAYRGEMPVVGHIPLSDTDRQIPFPQKSETFLTIPYTKTDIETFIATNRLG